jgi:quercetin dioxygenase-like cupin family protein
MKLILCSVLLLLAFLASAQAQVPVPLAHGNAPGEPHHHLKIENEYIRAYYVEVPPHEATQLHQHDHDYIYVSLGPSDVMNAPLNKPEVHLLLKDGETHFTRGGFAHVARNLSDKPFRNITIELLRPQGEAHNLCAQFISSDLLGKCDQPKPNYLAVKREFETSECLVEVVKLSPRMDLTLHAKELRFHFLLIPLEDSQISVAAKGNPGKQVTGGEVTWIDTADARFTNERSKVGAFLLVSFKDVASQLGQ